MPEYIGKILCPLCVISALQDEMLNLRGKNVTIGPLNQLHPNFPCRVISVSADNLPEMKNTIKKIREIIYDRAREASIVILVSYEAAYSMYKKLNYLSKRFNVGISLQRRRFTTQGIRERWVMIYCGGYNDIWSCTEMLLERSVRYKSMKYHVDYNNTTSKRQGNVRQSAEQTPNTASPDKLPKKENISCKPKVVFHKKAKVSLPRKPKVLSPKKLPNTSPYTAAFIVPKTVQISPPPLMKISDDMKWLQAGNAANVAGSSSQNSFEPLKASTPEKLE